MYGSRRRRVYFWRHPLTWVGGAIGAILLLVVLSKLLILLAYMTGGLIVLLIAIWLIWRWW